MATCLMDQYMKRTCGDFLNFAIKKSIISIMESRDSCELDLSRLDRASDAHVNAEHLLVLLNDVIESIFDSAHAAPPVLRYICGCLQKSVSSKWPENEIVRTRVVSVFIFLRLLSPAIRNPKSFNLITETPSETADRTLTLVAKCLQNLANLVEFGAKEPYMNVVNPFIVRNKARMVEFLNELSCPRESKRRKSHDVKAVDSWVSVLAQCGFKHDTRLFGHRPRTGVSPPHLRDASP